MQFNRYILRLVAILMFSIPLAAYAQKTSTVSATYTYHAQEDISINEAKSIAFERAKIQALAEEFGTKVYNSNTIIAKNSEKCSSVDMLSIGGSDVKGEWLETTSGPDYEISYGNGLLVVKCSVKGRAREISGAGVELDAAILRNGMDRKFESDEFKSGDDMYLLFKSPVDGYIAVYLLDDDDRVYRLLPYRGVNGDSYSIKGKREYLLFSSEHCPSADMNTVEEYTLEADKDIEMNRVYILFSRKPFVSAYNAEECGGELPVAELEKFLKWAASMRSKDDSMQIIERIIKITNK